MEIFNQQIKSDKITVCFFYSNWHSPSRNWAQDHGISSEEFDFLTINVEEESEISTRFKIVSIPTFIVFKSGEILFRHNGKSPNMNVRTWLETNIQLSIRKQEELNEI